MDIWSNVSGVVVIHKSKKVSLEGLVESIFDEYVFHYETVDLNDSWEYNFNINFECEGEKAYYTANELIDILDEQGAGWKELGVDLQYV